jgi:2-dehydropantoate 2-reductase
MRVAVVGLGAIGGWIAFKMSQAGCEVSAIARGATLDAVREQGIRLKQGEDVLSQPIKVSADPADLGPQDLVIVAVKGPALASVAPAVAALLGPETMVLPAMNGIPWWFFEGMPAPYGGRSLTSVDPSGEINAAIPRSRVIGCVVHASCASPEPGLIVPKAGRMMIIGEPAGGSSERLDRLAAVLRASDFDVEISPKIQQSIWYKLWGNMTMNPISAMTGATCDRVLDDPLVNDFVLRVMAEAAEVGGLIGCPINESGAARNAVTRKLGAFKTSMLQDAEAGRALELDALLGAPKEIAAWTGTPTPAMDSLLGLSRLFARSHGLYPPADPVAV